MKNLFFVLAFCAGVATAFAQSNNPYNSRGVDYVKALKIVEADYKAGKIKSLDQATLDHYNKTLPGRPQATVEMAAKITEAVKKSNPIQVIDQSKLSDKAKDLLKKSLNPKAKIEDLVAQASASTLSADEKEIVLTSMAITYQLKGDKLPNPRCQINGMSVPCEAVGAATGIIIGSAICGPVCAVGGAIIGAILGSLKD